MAFSMFMYRVLRGTYLGVPFRLPSYPTPTQSIYIYIYLSCLSSCHPVTLPSTLHRFRLSRSQPLAAQQISGHRLSLISLLFSSINQSRH